MLATHIPHRSEKKVGSAEKNTPAANSRASCISRVVYPYRMVSRHNRPSEALFFGCYPTHFFTTFCERWWGIGGIRVRLAPLGWRCALSRHLFCLFRGGKES